MEVSVRNKGFTYRWEEGSDTASVFFVGDDIPFDPVKVEDQTVEGFIEAVRHHADGKVVFNRGHSWDTDKGTCGHCGSDFIMAEAGIRCGQ